MIKSGISPSWLGGLASLLLVFGASSVTWAQDGLGEQLGARIDRGLNELGNEFRQGWASLRKTVDQLSVQGRVYSRLHWDKELADTRIEIEVAEEGVVSLRGTLKSSSAREKAVRLTKDTVGVVSVVNHLSVTDESVPR